MSEDTLNALIVALLGAGGATFVWTVFKSVIAWRDSAEGREDKAVARLEEFEAECRRQLLQERKWGRYWNRVAGIYEHALVVAGIDPPSVPRAPRREEDEEERNVR